MDSLPTSFGAEDPAAKRARIDRELAAERIAASRRDGQNGASTSRLIKAEDEDEEDGPAVQDGDEDMDDLDESQVNDRIAAQMPVSHEAILSDHSKTVSALSIDPAGARVVTGSYDFDCKLFDFGGMDSSLKSFRSWEPCGSYQIHDVAFNLAGDHILVASGTSIPKLFDRDAHEVGEFSKGDMYIRDMKQTHGHVAELSACVWHPSDANTFLTAAADSTIRIWDVKDKMKSKSTVVLKSKERGGRTRITAATYSPDGSMIVAAALDGTINLWGARSNFARPNATAEAHEKNAGISGLVYSLDGHSLVSRGMDGTVKYWDTRKFKKPVATATGLPNLNAETNIIFSPDDRFIITGTAGNKAAVIPGRPDLDEQGPKGKGKLVVMERDTLRVIRTIAVSEGSVVRTAWHPRINQIFATTSLGAVHVLYSPTDSQRGATMAMQRTARRIAEDSVPNAAAILTPEALPMFADPDAIKGVKKRKRTVEEHAVFKAFKPLPPMKGPGRGGRIGSAATAHVVQGLVHDRSREEDPREALLKYAEKTENDKQWTSAWAKTQPKPVWSRYMDDGDDTIDEKGKNKRT